MIRIFGGPQSICGGTVDREIETRIYKLLSDTGIAPLLYGHFGDGRIEQFVDGRILELDEMQVCMLVCGANKFRKMIKNKYRKSDMCGI